MTTVPVYTGTVPKRSGQSQAEFNTNTSDLLEYIGGTDPADFVPALNTVSGEVNTNAAIAEAAALTAIGASNAALWLTGTTYDDGDSAIDDINYLSYRCTADGTIGVQPSTDLTGKWILVVTFSTKPPTGVEITGNVAGMIMSNSADTDHDISMSAGACMDSTNSYHMSNASAVVKRIDAIWAAGSAAGGLLNGSVASLTLYHLYALRKDTDETADFGFLADGDSIATYKPAGYTFYRWVGYVVTDSSANIRSFHQNENVITFDEAFEVVSNMEETSYTSKDFSPGVPQGRTKSARVVPSIISAVDVFLSIAGVEDDQIYLSADLSGDMTQLNYKFPFVPLKNDSTILAKLSTGNTTDLRVRAVEIIR